MTCCVMSQTFMSGIIPVLTPRSFRLRRQDDMLCHAPDIYVWDHPSVNTEILPSATSG